MKYRGIIIKKGLVSSSVLKTLAPENKFTKTTFVRQQMFLLSKMYLVRTFGIMKLIPFKPITGIVFPQNWKTNFFIIDNRNSIVDIKVLKCS